MLQVKVIGGSWFGEYLDQGESQPERVIPSLRLRVEGLGSLESEARHPKA